MSDTIDRQAAIDTATEYEKQLREILGDENELAETIKILKHRIIALQPAEPERKTARWIEDGYSHYKAVCSECGEPCATYVVNTPRDRFCKWCGAKMEGVNETDRC